MTDGTDRRAAALKRLRAEIAADPLAQHGETFTDGVTRAGILLLILISRAEERSAIEGAPGYLKAARQYSIVLNMVGELADSLVAHGRATTRELAYPDTAEGGARLLRDEVLAAIDERLRLLGPDPK